MLRRGSPLPPSPGPFLGTWPLPLPSPSLQRFPGTQGDWELPSSSGRALGALGLSWRPPPASRRSDRSSLLQFMASHGNNAARATYESKVPSFYYRPTASDCQ